MISPRNLADLIRKSRELEAARAEAAHRHARTRPISGRDR